MPDRPLLVPVTADALVVNQGVHDHAPFDRWLADFAGLAEDYDCPEPPPFMDTDTPELGVYLRWRLPRALLNGRRDPASGRLDFPPVPNRWLVVRRPGPDEAGAIGWVIESDYLSDDDGTSNYLEPGGDVPVATYIGRALDLRKEWTESGTSTFLTAVGAGLPAFASFQPYNQDVFSFHDPLDGLPGHGPTPLSYLVAGWYSDPAQDMLADGTHTGAAVREILQTLGWDAEGTLDGVKRSMYAGHVLGLTWDPDVAPATSMPSAQNVRVAVGHDTEDAHQALLTGRGIDAREARLLTAFARGLPAGVPGARHEDAGTWDAARHDAWFARTAGGHRWRITAADRPGDTGGDGGRTAEADLGDSGLLEALNADQREHDQAVRTLTAQRSDLYHLWWLRHRAQRPDGFDTPCDRELDPDNPQGLAGRAAALVRRITALRRDRIPWGETPEELDQAVEEFAQAHGLAPDRRLERLAAADYYQAADPVVLLAGAGAGCDQPPSGPLQCRLPEQTTAAILFDDGWHSISKDYPAPPHLPDVPGLQELWPVLLAEFDLLHRARTQGPGPGQPSYLELAMALPQARVRGALPALMTVWKAQPWTPLYVQWQADVYPTPPLGADHSQWSFNGRTYTWTAPQHYAHPGPEPFSGRAFLSRRCGLVLAGAAARHARTYPDADRSDLRAFAEQAQEMDLLSQSLDGLNQWFARHDPAANVVLPPTQALAGLIADGGTTVPDPGPLPPTTYDPAPRFYPIRAGQFIFTRLQVVDGFGQVLDIITEQNHLGYPLYRAPSLTPTCAAPDIDKILEQRCLLQVPPRVVAPARLAWQWADARDDNRILDPDTDPCTLQEGDPSPVVGWLLPNHLDNTLAVYDPVGRALGDLRTVTDTGEATGDGGRVVWRALPQSPHPRLDEEFARDLPHLAAFLTALVARRAGALRALLAVVDTATLSTVPDADPAHDDLALLLGRPVALLRTRLAGQLAGPAIRDPHWATILAGQDPPHTREPFPVRLGTGDPSDALIGYFAPVGPSDPHTTSYDHLHLVHAPAGSDDYLLPISPGDDPRVHFAPPGPGSETDPGTGAPGVWVTLLADPYTTTYADCDLMPRVSLALPSRYRDQQLGRLDASFALGPLLVPDAPEPRPGNAPQPPSAVRMPRPAAWHGTWTWEQRSDDDEDSWTSHPITPADGAGRPADTAPDHGRPPARAGYLRLSKALYGAATPPPGAAL
ncbi:hypothetical protein [Streptomyces buecherae]|uniref:Uncharacterized protein n=1 Tax=Streptomyces buecherae TaxID=2763006 RepID=A0A7H8NGL3_9ACTN|nr:hypothetical protein [Streptomyces buecherae]QKW53601.1 hypothetical protein HUT08_33185 [Streptomyces buecherae]